MGDDDRSRSKERHKILLGVCAMEKKANGKPMQKILSIIESTGEFTIHIFEQKVILESPIEEWPEVNVLISFFSEGFPIDKAEAYIALRKPHCINDMTAQRILLDRRRVYALLSENQIPHPRALFVERDPETMALLGAAAENFVESDDFLKIGSDKIMKPFVEKPMDAEDHNVCIYYPSSAGGGRKRLFRKVGDKSSDFDPEVCAVRRDGSYMYEPFMQTQGTDIKIYTVGPEYAHAEARKSPVVDGKVLRNTDGKEIRYPVVLTQVEKEIARRVCLAFGQYVCGFDLLRTSEGSFVIDVNGWSFVKGVTKYYEDAAAVLVAYMERCVGRMPLPRSIDDMLRRDSAKIKDPKSVRPDRWAHQELLAVLAVMRHGDRTPKNKMKMTTSRAGFLQLHSRWSGGPHKEAKLKSPKQLQEVLDLVHTMLGKKGSSKRSGSKNVLSSDDGSENSETDATEGEGTSPAGRTRAMSMDENELEACLLVSAVLTEGGHFGGIYRKVQLKPIKWDPTGAVCELMLILKYGGILTPAGIAQAQTLGELFRSEMYPGDPGVAHSDGLLRLHATQRHDFKVFSSDEGRVQMSAAAFVQGLLALEKGSLTPICAALVETDSQMLDDVPSAAQQPMSDAKQKLHGRIQEACLVGSVQGVSETASMSMAEAMKVLHECVAQVNKDLAELTPSNVGKVACGSVGEASSSGNACVCGTTSAMLVTTRYKKLAGELWNAKKKIWDISKVPEIFDAVKYDLIHHPHLVPSFINVYDIAKVLNDVIVPNEYGHDMSSRMEIGSVVCGPLLNKLVKDLKAGREAKVECQVLPESSIVTAVEYLKQNCRDLLPDWQKEDKKSRAMTEDSGTSDMETAPADYVPRQESEFIGLDPTMAADLDIQSTDRLVRTRLYFTSESHIQALMNVLRYCHNGESTVFGLSECGELERPPAFCPPKRNSLPKPSSLPDVPAIESIPSASSLQPGVVNVEQESELCAEPVFDYLTQIVFRLYEDKRADADSEERYGVEVLFSPGARGHPSSAHANGHVLEVDRLRPLHALKEPLTLARLLELLSPCIQTAATGQGKMPDSRRASPPETPKGLKTPKGSKEGKDSKADSESKEAKESKPE